MRIDPIHDSPVDQITDDDIYVDGKIDDNSNVTLVSRNGDIVIKNKIDNNCTVTLIAAGNVSIGTEGDWDDRKIENNCNVTVDAGGSISLGAFIKNHCDVRFVSRGGVDLGGKIDDIDRITGYGGRYDCHRTDRRPDCKKDDRDQGDNAGTHCLHRKPLDG